MAVLINTGVRAGTPVQAAALPVGRRARPDGIVATHDAATGSVASMLMYRPIGAIGIRNTRSHVPPYNLASFDDFQSRNAYCLYESRPTVKS